MMGRKNIEAIKCFTGVVFFVIYHLKSVKNNDGVVATQLYCTDLKIKVHSLLNPIKYNYKFNINVK